MEHPFRMLFSNFQERGPWPALNENTEKWVDSRKTYKKEFISS